MTGSRILGGLAGLALLGLLLTGVQSWRLRIDEGEHQAYAASLRRAKELDARLDQEVASSRLGRVTHYDGLVRAWDRLRLNRDALAQPPSFLVGAPRERLLALVEAYGEALDDKREIVERFKSDQAVLRNSLRSLPHNADRIVVRSGLDEPPTRLAAALERLVGLVFRQVAAPHPEQAAEAERAWRALSVRPPTEPHAEEVGLVLRHARVALDRNRAVASAVDDILRVDVSGLADRAIRRYRAEHEAASARARAWRAAAGVCGALLLVFVSGFLIARLRRERDREAELAQVKSRFVSMTSHEFRTPLSVILSSAELLEAYGDRWPSEKRATHVDRIKGSAHAMTKMLDQVLLIGRAEAGMLELRASEFDLDALVVSVADEARAAAGPDRVLAVEVEGELGEVVADERLLRHVLSNLLSNAFKYSDDDAPVELRARADGRVATFAVSDEGIGIPREEQGRLFEAFHRCSNAGERPGTGLGLAVVLRSVEAHGGSVEVESVVGRGTTFTVRVPLMGGER